MILLPVTVQSFIPIIFQRMEKPLSSGWSSWLQWAWRQSNWIFSFFVSMRAEETTWARWPSRIKRVLPGSRWWLKRCKNLQNFCYVTLWGTKVFLHWDHLQTFPSVLSFIQNHWGNTLASTFIHADHYCYGFPISSVSRSRTLLLPSTPDSLWLPELQVTWILSLPNCLLNEATGGTS